MIEQARLREPGAWDALDHLYRPFVLAWFRGQLRNSLDAEDLTQDVLTVVHQELPAFEHSGRRGAFRRWLRTICMNRLLGYRRNQSLRGKAIGGSDFHALVQEVADTTDRSAQWDREYAEATLRFLFQRVEASFELRSIQIFRRLALDNLPAAEVAKEFGMTVGAVYVARSRVLRKLREEAECVLADSLEQDDITPESPNQDTT